MSKIYILENCGEPRQYTTKDGLTHPTQTMRVRELRKSSYYPKRYVLENLSGVDLRGHIGKPISCVIDNNLSEKDGREYNNLRTYEVITLAP